MNLEARQDKNNPKYKKKKCWRNQQGLHHLWDGVKRYSINIIRVLEGERENGAGKNIYGILADFCQTGSKTVTQRCIKFSKAQTR